MADNSQTTDPLAAENQPVDYDPEGEAGVPDADETFPDLVRDPGKGNNGDAPLWLGSQASDF